MVLINNVLKYFYDRKEEIKSSNKSFNYISNNVVYVVSLFEKKNPKAVRTKKERITILSKFAVRDSKNSLKIQKLVDY